LCKARIDFRLPQALSSLTVSIQKLLEEAQKESVMDKYDSPIDLIRGGHAFADADYGGRGPQSRPGQQVEIPNG
jgi:hypothetical protein